MGERQIFSNLFEFMFVYKVWIIVYLSLMVIVRDT